MEIPTQSEQLPTVPVHSPEQNSWGALIAIIVIMAVVIVGAFYAWGKRVSENHQSASVFDAMQSQE